MNALSDGCLSCFPGDAPAAVPLVIQANADGTLSADYRCPLCGLTWRTDWTVTTWPAVRVYRTTSQLLDEVIGLLAALFDDEELEAALNRPPYVTCRIAASLRGSTPRDGSATSTSPETEKGLGKSRLESVLRRKGESTEMSEEIPDQIEVRRRRAVSARALRAAVITAAVVIAIVLTVAW